MTFSKSGRTMYDHDKTFQTLDGRGYKANYVDINTGEWSWISGGRKDGHDRLYPGIVGIDEDVREEYWLTIRKKPECTHLTSYQSTGKHQK